MTPQNKNKIIKSIKLVFKNNDIGLLTKDAYRFVMNMDGFIAHYDIYGFKYHYQDLRLFAKDLLESEDVLNPERYVNDRFFTGKDADFYRTIYETLVEIPNVIRPYLTQ